jgi:hypothetical protein
MQAHDQRDVRTLFAAVFGHEISERFWHWKYGDGRGQAIIARDSGRRLVAHYGGITRTVCYCGRNEAAVQICDVMVAPTERSVLTRKGPFFLVTAEFLDRYIGFGKKHLVGFGFPSHRHLRLAEKLGLYAKVDTVVELHWPAGGKLSWRIAVLPVCRKRRAVGKVLNALWDEMRESLADVILPVRDAAWWRFRYLDHPEITYQVFLVKHRLTRRPLGCLAVKPMADGRWELMDWLAPLERAPLMVAAARALAAQAGASTVFGWFGERVARVVTDAATTTVDIGVGVPTNIRTPGPAVAEISGRWWLTGGDTDFR